MSKKRYKVMLVDENIYSSNRLKKKLWTSGIDIESHGLFQSTMERLINGAGEFDAVIVTDAPYTHPSSVWDFVDQKAQSSVRDLPLIFLWADLGGEHAASLRGITHRISKTAHYGDVALVVLTALREARSLPKAERSCQCGAAHTSFPGHHSSWCPAHSPG